MDHIVELFLAIFEFMLTKKMMLLAFFFFLLLLFVLAFFFFLCSCWDHITVSDRNPASASCPSRSHSRFRYDVFISFRGPDTRNGFTSHLFYALLRAGIKPFMDHKLEKGGEISRGLFDAIERSKILVVVLSQSFASSTWCLDELEKIMDCRRRRGCTVLPVFYGVKPVEVRRQTGRYEVALAMHQNGSQDKGMAEKVKRWREALTEIANLFGYDSDVVSPEGKLVHDIVDDILKMLRNPNLTRTSSQTITRNKSGSMNEVRSRGEEITGREREGGPPPSGREDVALAEEEQAAAAIACLVRRFIVADTLLAFVENATALERFRTTNFTSESVILPCN